MRSKNILRLFPSPAPFLQLPGSPDGRIHEMVFPIHREDSLENLSGKLCIVGSAEHLHSSGRE